MELMEKLTILTDSAKYDVACTSSGVNRPGTPGGVGNAVAAGICHTFASDGRCVSLLKVLQSNICEYDCAYCVNRRSNDIPRAAFTGKELADLTIAFYRRNYIEGLFLSSAVTHSPDATMDCMVQTLSLLRGQYGFRGYIHAKAIPGSSPDAIHRLGLLADRMSVNIELPSERSLTLLAPRKTRRAILAPMTQIKRTDEPRFVPAGQATQLIIGASPETDYHILRLADGLYDRFGMRRVFYSAYIPIAESSLLPALTAPPLLREHRLYQADFLLRQYDFGVDEILSESAPSLNPYVDPKCNWALCNPHRFPMDVNSVPKADLLRIPGIGPRSVERILIARRHTRLTTDDLKRLGVVMKRARHFIITADCPTGPHVSREAVVRALMDPSVKNVGMEQLSMFPGRMGSAALPGFADAPAWPIAIEEAVACLKAAL
ncbi:putative DNA modification/repair radical SAM protein [Clostridia bacterium]|nr:putative DNA modification/repair radical SAM protein [Clostridia bacterium]